MNKKILIIDDNEDILEGLKLLLELEGFETRTLTDGNSTLAIASMYRPDIILLDVMLSGCDGRDIAECLRKHKKLRKIPIIMLSADSATKEAALKSGADMFFEKPLEMNHLLSTIKRYVKKEPVYNDGDF